MTLVLLAAFLLFLAAGLVALRHAGLLRQRSGLPAGELVYIDTAHWAPCERPLFSDRHRLTGRPDYLVRQNNRVIPVEVKSRRGVVHPPESHVFQLLAYCLLVEESEGHPPPYGLLHYPDSTFRIPYTDRERTQVIETLRHLRQDLGTREVARSHADPRRCRACGFHAECRQGL